MEKIFTGKRPSIQELSIPGVSQEILFDPNKVFSEENHDIVINYLKNLMTNETMYPLFTQDIVQYLTVFPDKKNNFDAELNDFRQTKELLSRLENALKNYPDELSDYMLMSEWRLLTLIDPSVYVESVELSKKYGERLIEPITDVLENTDFEIESMGVFLALGSECPIHAFDQLISDTIGYLELYPQSEYNSYTNVLALKRILTSQTLDQLHDDQTNKRIEQYKRACELDMKSIFKTAESDSNSSDIEGHMERILSNIYTLTILSAHNVKVTENGLEIEFYPSKIDEKNCEVPQTRRF